MRKVKGLHLKYRIGRMNRKITENKDKASFVAIMALVGAITCHLSFLIITVYIFGVMLNEWFNYG